MRQPSDVTALAANRYRRTWRDALIDPQRATNFPLDPPTAQVIVSAPHDVAAWLTAWREWTEQHPTVTLRPKTVRTAHGDQRVYTHLDIPDTSALAALDDRNAEHWARATTRWQRMPHDAYDAIKPWLAQIVDLTEPDFALVLAATGWFRANPRSGLTIRRVPVPGMHTKWLARHRRLVLAALGHSLNGADENASDDTDPADVPTADLDALGLRPIPREADLILTDPNDRQLVAGLRHLRSSVDELANLPLEPSHVLVIENKEAALSIGDHPGLVIIHSLGNHTDALRQLPWLPDGHTTYWGDIDRHGYTMLSRARTAVPHLRSMLMSADDATRHRHLAVVESLTRYDPPDDTLTSGEAAALTSLATNDGYLRIEQERLPSEHVLAALHRHL